MEGLRQTVGVGGEDARLAPAKRKARSQGNVAFIAGRPSTFFVAATIFGDPIAGTGRWHRRVLEDDGLELEKGQDNGGEEFVVESEPSHVGQIDLEKT